MKALWKFVANFIPNFKYIGGDLKPPINKLNKYDYAIIKIYIYIISWLKNYETISNIILFISKHLKAFRLSGLL